jgi:hypothetical protein
MAEVCLAFSLSFLLGLVVGSVLCTIAWLLEDE